MAFFESQEKMVAGTSNHCIIINWRIAGFRWQFGYRSIYLYVILIIPYEQAKAFGNYTGTGVGIRRFILVFPYKKARAG